MIPEHYPVEAGKIFAGEYPGARSSERAGARLKCLADMGIRTFVDLTAIADDMAPYEDLLAAHAGPDGAPQRHWKPIDDMSVPDSPEAMREILEIIRESHVAGRPVYIHCWGGIGRTGTVVGCWLRERGLGPDEALAEVSRLYRGNMAKSKWNPDSPQTARQREFVRKWMPENEKGGPG